MTEPDRFFSDDFDPEHVDVRDKSSWDEYVNWCVFQTNQMVTEKVPENLGLGYRYLACMLVVSSMAINLAEDIEIIGFKRTDIEEAIARQATFARCVERGAEHIKLRDFLVHRAALSPYVPQGRFSGDVLRAQKACLAGLYLAHSYGEVAMMSPDSEAPDVWNLCGVAAHHMAMIEPNADGDTEDYSVAIDQRVIDRARWQLAHNVSRATGAPPPSQN